MKRGLAWLTALVLAFSCFAAWAENAEPTEPAPENDETLDVVAIEENMVSRDDRLSAGALGDNLKLVVSLLKSDDFRHILRIQDVKDVLNEVVLRLLKWLWENRPITMKILNELGVGQDEQSIISTIWDSAERIEAAEISYMQSDDGQELQKELDELRENPACQELVEDFIEMASARDVNSILEAIQSTRNDLDSQDVPDVNNQFIMEQAEKVNIKLSEEDAEEVARILESTLELTWAGAAITKLMETKIFWKVILHLYESHLSQQGGIISKEIRTLLSDPRVKDYVSHLLSTAAEFCRQMGQSEDDAAETGGEAGNAEESNQDAGDPPAAEEVKNP